MAFRAIPEIKQFFEETEDESVEIPLESAPVSTPVSAATQVTPAELERQETKKKLIQYGTRVWKRVGLMVVILLTILTALAFNSLVQSFLQGLSPNKEHGSILLIIISQLLYALLVMTFLIIAVFFIIRKEARATVERKEQLKATKLLGDTVKSFVNQPANPSTQPS